MLKPYQRPDLDKLNLRAGVPLESGGGGLLAGVQSVDEEDKAHTIALVYTPPDRWMGAVVQWTSGSVCRARGTAPRFHAVSMRGQCLTFGEDVFAATDIGPGIFSNLGSVAGRPYVVGMRGAIYRQADSGAWDPIGGAGTDQSFEAICGFSEDESYAVGWEGVIGLIEGTRVTRIDGPTNRILSAACCASDGFVYCCGQRGTLLRGRRHEWTVLDQDVTTEDLWDVHAFQGRIFVASMRLLYEWRDGELRPVAFGEDIPLSFYRLRSVGDQRMWSIGAKDLMTFDGREWSRLL